MGWLDFRLDILLSWAVDICMLGELLREEENISFKAKVFTFLGEEKWFIVQTSEYNEIS